MKFSTLITILSLASTALSLPSGSKKESSKVVKSDNPLKEDIAKARALIEKFNQDAVLLIKDRFATGYYNNKIDGSDDGGSVGEGNGGNNAEINRMNKKKSLKSKKLNKRENAGDEKKPFHEMFAEVLRKDGYHDTADKVLKIGNKDKGKVKRDGEERCYHADRVKREIIERRKKNKNKVKKEAVKEKNESIRDSELNLTRKPKPDVKPTSQDQDQKVAEAYLQGMGYSPCSSPHIGRNTISGFPGFLRLAKPAKKAQAGPVLETVDAKTYKAALDLLSSLTEEEKALALSIYLEQLVEKAEKSRSSVPEATATKAADATETAKSTDTDFIRNDKNTTASASAGEDANAVLLQKLSNTTAEVAKDTKEKNKISSTETADAAPDATPSAAADTEERRSEDPEVALHRVGYHNDTPKRPVIEHIKEEDNKDKKKPGDQEQYRHKLKPLSPEQKAVTMAHWRKPFNDSWFDASAKITRFTTRPDPGTRKLTEKEEALLEPILLRTWKKMGGFHLPTPRLPEIDSKEFYVLDYPPNYYNEDGSLKEEMLAQLNGTKAADAPREAYENVEKAIADQELLDKEKINLEELRIRIVHDAALRDHVRHLQIKAAAAAAAKQEKRNKRQSADGNTTTISLSDEPYFDTTFSDALSILYLNGTSFSSNSSNRYAGHLSALPPFAQLYVNKTLSHVRNLTLEARLKMVPVNALIVHRTRRTIVDERDDPRRHREPVQKNFKRMLNLTRPMSSTDNAVKDLNDAIAAERTQTRLRNSLELAMLTSYARSLEELVALLSFAVFEEFNAIVELSDALASMKLSEEERLEKVKGVIAKSKEEIDAIVAGSGYKSNATAPAPATAMGESSGDDEVSEKLTLETEIEHKLVYENGTLTQNTTEVEQNVKVEEEVEEKEVEEKEVLKENGKVGDMTVITDGGFAIDIQV